MVRRRDEKLDALQGVNRHLFGHLEAIRIDADAALKALGSFADADVFPILETSIRLIEGRQFRLTVCDFGRVHTNLTNLKRELRTSLRVGGRPLVNLDIRNSQPLIFATILKARFQAAPTPSDVSQYIELVQAGRFYDHVMEAWGIPSDERSAFKKTFFGRVFYCESRPLRDEAERFGEMFPNVISVIHDLKKEDYRNLAHKLQRAESSIMIQGVAARCMKEMPEVFIATIHDSILCTAEWADRVKTIMMDEFEKVGLVPTVNVEDV